MRKLMVTTIKLTIRTRNKLKNLGKKGETYEDVIKELLKWTHYKERNKYLEQIFHKQEKEIEKLQKNGRNKSEK